MKTRLAIIALTGVLALVGALAVGTPATSAAVYLNETFDDHANNWNIAAGPWYRKDPGNGDMRYSPCVAPGPPIERPVRFPAVLCQDALPTRSWIGVASDSHAYTIDVDIWLNGDAEECKVIYTGANNNEDFRVDLRRIANQVRITGPAPGNVLTWPAGVGANQITGGTPGTKYHLTVDVTRTAVTVTYKKGANAPVTVGPLSTGLYYPDGKVGVGTYLNDDCDFDNVTVTGTEGIGLGNAKLIPVFGYERTEACDEGPANTWLKSGEPNEGERLTELECDRPLYVPWDRGNQAWWNTMVEEMDHGEIEIVAAHNRGCFLPIADQEHGWGDMCPTHLAKLRDAITARESSIKVAMFDDLPMVGEEYKAGSWPKIPFPMNQANLWEEWLWTKRWEVFYDAVPAGLRATVDGRPLIFIWDPGPDIANTQGNLRPALEFLRNKVKDKTGANPFIVVSFGFWSADTTLGNQVTVGGQQVDAVDAVYSWWHNPATSNGTQDPITHNGFTGGTIVPGFRDAPHGPGECVAPCREVKRAHGQELIQSLELHKLTDFVLLEGWTNVIESAGWYRSLEGNDPGGCTQAAEANTVDFPNQVINIVQRYADPSRAVVTLEAEAADEYFDTTFGNSGGAYRKTAGCAPGYNHLDVGEAMDTYYVGWVAPGEWIRFRDVYLSGGDYTVVLRYATTDPNAEVCVRVNNGVSSTPPSCETLAPTGGATTWAIVPLDTINLHKGLSLDPPFLR